MNSFYFTCIAVFIGSYGYAIINNIPRRNLFFAAINGCAGYAVYLLFMPHEIVGCFYGACVIAALGELLARVMKDAATLFIIPGIIPLVPGAKMYNMTLCLLHQQFIEAATLGVQVIMYAGGIALAILLVSSTIRSLFKQPIKLKK